MRILLVEDNRDVAAPLKMLLELEGHTVQHALTGQKAIEAANSHAPDAVICDLTLPDTDGTSLIRRLGPGPLYVAMTGRSRTEVSEACERAGFTALLQKPLDIDALLRVLGN